MVVLKRSGQKHYSTPSFLVIWWDSFTCKKKFAAY